MSKSNENNGAGFSERGQETCGDIPTEPDAFLAWRANLDRHHPYKYELSGGKVSRMMIKISRAHWRVSANLLGELSQKLDRERFEAGPAEFGVKTGVGVRYPDVVVDLASAGLKDLACEAPVIVAEVLSPSTTALDLTTKQREYTAIATLQAYIVCSQDEPLVWLWARKADGSWPIDAQMIEGREASIHLGGLGIALSMAAIFRGIPDAPTP
jgi:Uma2 family endonuclease